MKKANPATIGGFVVGAILLLVGGVVFLGGGQLFRDTERMVAYFDGSVNGLMVGSPVKLEGVVIGSVVSIRALADVDPLELTTETIIEIDRSRFERRYRGKEVSGELSGHIDEIVIEQGLRARLELESLITGQLYVSLVVEPDTPVRLVHATRVPYQEVPTIPTRGQELEQNIRSALAKLQALPLEEIVENLDQTLIAARDTFRETSILTKNANARLGPLTDSTVAAMDQARDTLESAQETIEPGSPVAYQFSLTLKELSQAARAIRVLADYIEKNPNSLVFGRSQVSP